MVLLYYYYIVLSLRLGRLWRGGECRVERKNYKINILRIDSYLDVIEVWNRAFGDADPDPIPGIIDTSMILDYSS